MSSTLCGVEHCKIEKRNHGQRWTQQTGYHVWIAPTKEQIIKRLRQRYGIL